jgi:succinate dehydrogenase hydrophobic anchor subunit
VRNGSKARLVNGIISALVVVFFVAHSLLGGLEALVPLASPPALVMWTGIGIVGIHIVASIITSREQLTDAEFPPSQRKKRHLALKWVTGGILLAIIAAHVVCIRTFGPDAVQASVTSTLIALALVAALTVHIWVGAKSLITDLSLDKGLIKPFRIIVCTLAIAIGCIIIAGIVWWR